MIKFFCLNCGQSIAANAEDAGKDSHCPSCGGAVVVPNRVTTEPVARPWTTSLAQNEEGWLLTVSFPSLDEQRFSRILKLAGIFKKCQPPHGAHYASCDATQQSLVFVLSSGTRPVRLVDALSRSETNAEVDSLADSLIEHAKKLHSHQLGVWSLDEDSCWRCGADMVMVPSFWVSAFSIEERTQTPKLAPELYSDTIPSAYIVPADIFAISQAVARLLTGGNPSGPCADLTGIEKEEIGPWEAFVDAGLRSRPERRPRSLQLLRDLVPSMTTSRALPAGHSRLQAPPTELHRNCPEISGSPPPGSDGLPRRKRSRAASAFLVTGMILAAMILAIALLHFLNEDTLKNPSDYRRGFGDTILQYPNRSYEDSHWKEVYSNKRLLPADAIFDSIVGWDDSSFTIFGGIELHPGGSRTLILHHRDQQWTWTSYERFASGGYSYDVKDARYLSRGKIAAVLPGNQDGEPYLAEISQGGITQIAKDADCRFLAQISEDTFFGADEIHRKTWLLRSGHMSTPEENERNQYIVNGDNTIAQGSDDDELTTADIFASATISPGKSVALFRSEGGDDSGIAEYRNGRWHLVTLTSDLLRRGRPRPWVDSHGNVTAIGEGGIVRFADGRVSVESISVSGQEIQTATIAAVWGHDHELYWATDRRGNVYEKRAGSWRLAVRGPALEEEEIFADVWPTPGGNLVAITKDKVFLLNK